MNETRYLVDNNALTDLGSRRIRSDFFRDHCQVTADVLWEATDHPDWQLLSESTRDMTPRVIEQIRRVMNSVPPGDIELIDLYKNKGAADPGLVASILDAIASDEGVFFEDEWVLVTNDRAVVAKAHEFGIQTMAAAELRALIDSIAD